MLVISRRRCRPNRLSHRFVSRRGFFSRRRQPAGPARPCQRRRMIDESFRRAIDLLRGVMACRLVSGLLLVGIVPILFGRSNASSAPQTGLLQWRVFFEPACSRLDVDCYQLVVTNDRGEPGSFVPVDLSVESHVMTDGFVEIEPVGGASNPLVALRISKVIKRTTDREGQLYFSVIASERNESEPILVARCRNSMHHERLPAPLR